MNHLLKNLLKTCDTPERRRAVAYHEAGHAAAIFLIGDANNLRQVTARPTLARQGLCSFRPLPAFLVIASDSPKALRLGAARRFALVQLAGPCAAGIADGEGPGAWLEREADDAWGDDESSDYAHSFKAARLLYPKSDRAAMQFVERCAGKVHELLSDRRVWPVVDALATRLRKGRTVQGASAARIMATAWMEAGNADSALPILDLGRTWQAFFMDGKDR